MRYPELKTTLFFQEGYIEGFQEGIEIGRREERPKMQKSIAQSMKQKGFPLAEIADVLNLTPEEMERLLSDESPSIKAR